MKRCPQCRRDYYDDSLAYCLEDGAILLDGPGSVSDEPATAILSGPTEPQKRSFTPAGSTDDEKLQKTRGASDRSYLVAGIVGVIAVIALGVGSYFYYGRSASKQVDSIAVMPFVNDSGSADLEFLSDGMTETLIRSLSQLPNLIVKARPLYNDARFRELLKRMGMPDQPDRL